MHLLLTNDDGIDAPGLQALERHVQTFGELVTVAPDQEQSAKSHALTLHEALRLRTRGERRFAVSGTPADCVYMGLFHLMNGRTLDAVISGINNGANLGADVYYSGTVAAAREACLAGVPSLAVSLVRARTREEVHWDTAGEIVRQILQRGVLAKLPPGSFLNVNVPNVPLSALKGVRSAVLGRRKYANRVEERTDPRGHRYYWIGGPLEGIAEIPGSDCVAVEEGFAAMTPLHVDMTLHPMLDVLGGW